MSLGLRFTEINRKERNKIALGKLIARLVMPLFERIGEKMLRGEAGWICTNCGSKHGPPPYLTHSSLGCRECMPSLYSAKPKGEKE